MDEKVYQVLDKMGIAYEKYEHPAMYTVADGEKMELDFGEAMDCKNLFLKDARKDAYYLVCLPCSKRANIKTITKEVGAKKLCFASEEELGNYLGVKSGAASILNIVEVEQTEKITFVLDRKLKEAEMVCFHPNLNTASIAFKRQDMERILDHYHAKYAYLEV